MKNTLKLVVVLMATILAAACNPNCDSLTGVQLSTQLNPSGHQLILTATPSSALEGRRVFFNDQEAEKIFIPENGLVVTVPEGLSGQVELRIEDLDCVDFVSFNFDVVDESFFLDNLEFIFPPIPEIIIPSVSTSFPPSIENAWLHPVNTDYCFWLKLLPDTLGYCTKFFDPQRSFEQSICGNENVLYASNPISGRIEPDGSVFLTVDRANGTEDFTGKLINPEDVPEKYQGWQVLDCNGNLNSSQWDGSFKQRDFMMLLTSANTGRQLLIYQQNIPGIGVDCQ